MELNLLNEFTSWNGFYSKLSDMHNKHIAEVRLGRGTNQSCPAGRPLSASEKKAKKKDKKGSDDMPGDENDPFDIPDKPEPGKLTDEKGAGHECEITKPLTYKLADILSYVDKCFLNYAHEGTKKPPAFKLTFKDKSDVTDLSLKNIYFHLVNVLSKNAPKVKLVDDGADEFKIRKMPEHYDDVFEGRLDLARWSDKDLKKKHLLKNWFINEHAFNDQIEALVFQYRRIVGETGGSNRLVSEDLPDNLVEVDKANAVTPGKKPNVITKTCENSVKLAVDAAEPLSQVPAAHKEVLPGFEKISNELKPVLAALLVKIKLVILYQYYGVALGLHICDEEMQMWEELKDFKLITSTKPNEFVDLCNNLTYNFASGGGGIKAGPGPHFVKYGVACCAAILYLDDKLSKESSMEMIKSLLLEAEEKDGLLKTMRSHDLDELLGDIADAITDPTEQKKLKDNVASAVKLIRSVCGHVDIGGNEVEASHPDIKKIESENRPPMFDKDDNKLDGLISKTASGAGSGVSLDFSKCLFALMKHWVPVAGNYALMQNGDVDSLKLPTDDAIKKVLDEQEVVDMAFEFENRIEYDVCLINRLMNMTIDDKKVYQVLWNRISTTNKALSKIVDHLTKYYSGIGTGLGEDPDECFGFGDASLKDIKRMIAGRSRSLSKKKKDKKINLKDIIRKSIDKYKKSSPINIKYNDNVLEMYISHVVPSIIMCEEKNITSGVVTKELDKYLHQNAAFMNSLVDSYISEVTNTLNKLKVKGQNYTQYGFHTSSSESEED